MIFLLAGIVCLVRLSAGSDQLRAFLLDIEDTTKQLKECTEQLAEATALNEQMNETNVQLAADIEKQKGMIMVSFSKSYFYH